jgi:predicted permease
MSAFLLDLRHALRVQVRRPVVLVTATLSIAVGLASTAAFFGVVDRLLLRPPLRVRSPQEIVRFYYARQTTLRPSPWTSIPVYDALREGLVHHVALAAQSSKTVVIGRGVDARERTAALATSNVFSVLGVSPILGRFFEPSEERASPPHTAVLSYELWRSSYGADANVLGHDVLVSGHWFTVVGVAPAGFSGIDRERVDLWLPLGAATFLVSATALTSETEYWVSLFGRCPPNAVDAVSRLATTMLRDIEKRQGFGGDPTVVLGPIVGERGPGRSPQIAFPIWVTAASGVLLLIACGNVANLLLLRFVDRQKELATRFSLGASRTRLVRHVVIEAVTVTVLGGACALLLVLWGGSAARTLLFPSLTVSGPELDMRALWQMTLLCGGVAFVCALPPSLLVLLGRFPIAPTAGPITQTRFQRRAGGILVIIQCAFSAALLVGAGLFATSLYHVSRIDLGVDLDHLAHARVELTATLKKADAVMLYQMLAGRVSAIPGVDGATVVMGMPLRTVWAVAVTLPGDVWSGRNPVVLGHAVGKDYAEITGLRITRGRDFDPSEYEGSAQVALVNESFARRFWPDRSPLGACLRLGSNASCTRVIGVAADTPRWSITAERELELYVPLDPPLRWGQAGTLGLAIRTRSNPHDVVASIRNVLQSSDSHIAYAEVTPMSEIVEPQLRPSRLGSTLFRLFGLVALALAAVGIYGLLAHAVAQQRKATGIRLALGAKPARIWRAVIMRGVVLCALGALAGIGAAILLAPIAASLLYGVSARDPRILLGSATSVLFVGISASYVPAYRATRADLMGVLRDE